MPSQIAETIAGQLHHMAPDWVKPGKNVGMEVRNGDTLEIYIMHEPSRVVWVTLDEGADLYNVRTYWDQKQPGREFVEEVEGVFCDQLGELVWGEDAKPWTMPFGALYVDGEKVSEW